ncbi:MAG: MBL fold metallo-hydrolase [Candidatus Sericytochromatia bacterium]|nr:MBL fold metallo-hydrolase [Candidatus Sericytochromatia bacterium]
MTIKSSVDSCVKLKLLEGGYCTHKEKMVIRGGINEDVKFHSMFALIIHPTEGVILYDTGYTKRFYQETNKFPYNLYAKITPVYVKDEDTAISKLRSMNIQAEDVKYIIISHFHADHISALKDFPKAKFIYFKNGYDKVKNLKGFFAVKEGFLSGLLPDDFIERSIMIDSEKDQYKIKNIEPFEQAFDYFGDGLIKFIPLPGHYRGHLGALVQGENNQKYFLIADSCWLSKSFKENILPHPFANIIMDNSNKYEQTLNKINTFYKNNPDTEIIPSHCNEIYNKYIGK